MTACNNEHCIPPAVCTPSGSIHGASARRKILLVEDDAVLAMVESLEITPLGYEVISVRSGEEAIDLITTDPSIDLVLMDIDLGCGIDGTEAATQILTVRAIPILFLTSHPEQVVVDRLRAIKSCGYLLKGFDDDVLQSSLETAFELFEARGMIREMEESLPPPAHTQATLLP